MPRHLKHSFSSMHCRGRQKSEKGKYDSEKSRAITPARTNVQVRSLELVKNKTVNQAAERYNSLSKFRKHYLRSSDHKAYLLQINQWTLASGFLVRMNQGTSRR